MLHTCKGCTERHVGCHAKCEKYKAYKADCDKRRQYLNDTRPPILRNESWSGWTEFSGKRRRHDGKNS